MKWKKDESIVARLRRTAALTSSGNPPKFPRTWG